MQLLRSLTKLLRCKSLRQNAPTTAATHGLVHIALSALCCAYPSVWAQTPIEVHDIITSATPTRNIALTLDACSGAFDDDLIEFLIRNRIPATLFATKKWLLKNPQGVAIIKAHLDLFDVENHGENHIPAVLGAGRKVYGIAGEPDLLHLRQEVSEGAKAITQMIGVPPHWYRGATAEYDPKAIAEIGRMGFGIAGFSVNADAGATLRKPAVEQRLRQVKGGDVIIAHMNKPTSDTAEGLSTGLLQLLRNGLVFVRLDQVELSPTNLPKEVSVRPSSNQ